MSKKQHMTRLVPRIGKPPMVYNLLPWEFEVTRSIDSCPIEHSNFIAEHCRLSGTTIELLLRYTKQSNSQSIEECAKDIGLQFNGSWREPFKKDASLPDLPKIALKIKKDIVQEMLEWQSKQK